MFIHINLPSIVYLPTNPIFFNALHIHTLTLSVNIYTQPYVRNKRRDDERNAFQKVC